VNIPGRFVCLATSALLVAGLGVTAGAAPASATVTTLCKCYTACAKAGYSSSGYASANKKMYWRMYAGHNCTNYAAYRMVRSGLSNTRPWTGSGNATNWGKAMSGITNKYPRVGAVAWWKAGVSPAGSSGHVAYVERVISSSEIIVSMDSWGGDFSWGRVTKTTKGWPSGFVHFNDVKQLNTKAPAITGTSKVGSVLTSSTGTWKPSGARLSYRWAQDGAWISGATAKTLLLTKANEGKKITARVTARHTGYPTVSVISRPTAAVQPGVITNTGRPTVTGDPRVDATLSATPGTWTPAPDQVTYQWRADDAPIDGATGSTLTMDPAFASKRISVTTTATKEGYAPVSATSAPTAEVQLGTMRMTVSPTVIGAPELGGTLRLGRPASTPRPSLAVTWLRSGHAIPGATGLTYRITRADLGSRISASVRMSRAGYKPLRARTPSTVRARTTPVVRVTTRPGHGRMAMSTRVRAPGVPVVNGEMTVRSRGRLLATLHVRNGYARVSLKHLTRGTRVFRFRLASTRTTHGFVLNRRVHIR
jgi:surface antigen